jgi:hypothetical protein
MPLDRVRIRPISPSASTFRYQMFDAGKIVRLASTTDLEAARTACRERWPTGRFFQVGERTTESNAEAWVKKNGVTAKA